METIDRLIRALQYPLDDPSQTLIAVFVVVVVGLLVAVVLIAIASPGSTPDDSSLDSGFPEDQNDVSVDP